MDSYNVQKKKNQASHNHFMTAQKCDYQVLSLITNFRELTLDEKLKVSPAGRPDSWRAGLLFAIFSLSSLSAPPPALHPPPLSSPPQGKQFCSATHCAIFGPLCYLLFKDAVAVVGASKQ